MFSHQVGRLPHYTGRRNRFAKTTSRSGQLVDSALQTVANAADYGYFRATLG
jgi:hypothetical protein